MTALESWLQQATRHLSADSAAQVRTEIREHYESAREAALAAPGGGTVTEEEADRLAVIALGDPKAANCQYRKVLLTTSEARLLREGNWEARAICSRPWLRWLLLAMTAAAVFAANEFFLRGSYSLAATLLAGGLGIGLIFAAPFLPVYTPLRGRVFRAVKWVAMLAVFALAFGPDILKWSWLLVSCLWPVFWVEWTRVSIRRKLPVAEWPKQLYL